MKKNRLGLATGLLLVLMGLTAWRLSARNAEDQAAPKVEVKLPKLKRDAIDELEMTTPEHGKVRFVKKGDEWQVVEPIAGRADQDAVSSALGKLEELEATGVAATKKQNHTRLEVDGTKGTRVVAKGSGKVLLDGYIGNYQSGNSMFRIEGQESVATVRGSIRYAFNKRLPEWRDRTITKYEPDDVQEIVFDNKNGHFQWTRTGPEEFKQVLGKGEKAIEPLDMPKVRGLVGTAAAITASDIADGVSVEQAGLGAGAATALIKMKSGDGGVNQLLYRIGGKKDENFYVQRDGVDTIFLVSTWIGNRLVPDRETFVKKEPEKSADGPMGSRGNPIPVEPTMRQMMPGMPGMPPGHP
jgi:Domain of unknown function (DUF4340)